MQSFLKGQDIDSGNDVIRVRQQVHRAGGELHIGPVKTRAGRAGLGLARAALAARRNAQLAGRTRLVCLG